MKIAMPPACLEAVLGRDRLVRPDERHQTEQSNEQAERVMVPSGAYGDDELSEERQNVHKTCGNGPTSCPRFSVPNCPSRHSTNGGYVNQKDRSDEQAPQK